jgi:hypothetical protein
MGQIHNICTIIVLLEKSGVQVYDVLSQNGSVFREYVLFFNSLCTFYVAIVHMYVKLYSIFLFNEGSKFIMYAVIMSYTDVPRLFVIR